MSIRETLNQQAHIEEALTRYSKDELIGLISNLMKTYVLDGVAPLKPEVGKVHIPMHLRDLPFPALIDTLKFHLDLPDLDKFNVVDGQVYVRLGDREFALDGPAPAPAARQAPRPAAAAPPAAEAAPPPERRVEPAPERRPEPPPREREQPAAPKEADDRFRMLELD